MFEKKHHASFVLMTFAGGCLWMAILLLNSLGTPLHDEIGHFLISRDALHTPAHIFDIWGRTLHTLLYIIPAQSGLGGARLVSLLIALVIALFTYKIANIFKMRYAFLVPLLLWCQPWFADLSYLCITQVPFSLIMILGAFLYLKKNFLGAALVIGLLPLIRHEGIALLGIVFIYLLIKKEWVAAFALFAPLFVYNVVYFSFQGVWPFALYFDSKPNTIYGHGTWHHFLIRLPHPRAVGIPIMLLVTASVIPLVRTLKTNTRLIEIYTWYFIYFILHTVIFRFGLFASGGYKLFLLPIAPVLAIASAYGLEWIVTTISSYLKQFPLFNKSFASENTLFSLICIVCLIFALIQVKPHPLDSLDLAVKEAAEWTHVNRINRKNIIATHVFYYYFLPLRVPPVTLWEKFPPLSDIPPGTIVIWDDKYSNMWDIKKEYFNHHSKEWERVKTFKDGLVTVYRKTRQRNDSENI